MTNWEAGLSTAINSRASPKVIVFVLLQHGRHPLASKYVTHMNKTVKHLCCRFHQLILFFSEHITMRRFNIQYKIKCIIIVWNLTAQSTKIKIILNVLIINFTEKFISSQIAKPRDPRCVISIRTTNIRLLTVCLRFLSK